MGIRHHKTVWRGETLLVLFCSVETACASCLVVDGLLNRKVFCDLRSKLSRQISLQLLAVAELKESCATMRGRGGRGVVKILKACRSGRVSFLCAWARTTGRLTASSRLHPRFEVTSKAKQRDAVSPLFVHHTTPHHVYRLRADPTVSANASTENHRERETVLVNPHYGIGTTYFSRFCQKQNHLSEHGGTAVFAHLS